MYLNLVPKKVFEIKHKNSYNIREKNERIKGKLR